MSRAFIDNQSSNLYFTIHKHGLDHVDNVITCHVLFVFNLIHLVDLIQEVIDQLR